MRRLRQIRLLIAFSALSLGGAQASAISASVFAHVTDHGAPADGVPPFHDGQLDLRDGRGSPARSAGHCPGCLIDRNPAGSLPATPTAPASATVTTGPRPDASSIDPEAPASPSSRAPPSS